MLNICDAGRYKELEGLYSYQQTHPHFQLAIDSVQPDIHAPPSRMRVIIPWEEVNLRLDDFMEDEVRMVALCDWMTREAAEHMQSGVLNTTLREVRGRPHGIRGGVFGINAPGQQVLPRTSCIIDNDQLELRFTIALPVAGNAIPGAEACELLCDSTVKLVRWTLWRDDGKDARMAKHIITVRNQHFLRLDVIDGGLVAFVANGSILPRESAASDRPLADGKATRFQGPTTPRFQRSFMLRDGTLVQGLGIPKGVTLLTGGGFHGKSTLLQALQFGIYNHIPGDGRELVVTDPYAVKIRVEEGRSVTNVDISRFLLRLPNGASTEHFSSEDTSGVTGMAVNIEEALETGCRTLLIDENSSALNLLVRAQRIRMLWDNRPRRPLVMRLYENQAVSTVIVVTATSDWLEIPTMVLRMVNYMADDGTTVQADQYAALKAKSGRRPKCEVMDPREVKVHLNQFEAPVAGSRPFIDLKVKKGLAVFDPGAAASGIDISGLTQLVEGGQARMIATIIERVGRAFHECA